MAGLVRITIIGAPRTKKTHNQGSIARASGKGQPCPACRAPLRVRVFPSKPWRQWVKEASVTIDGEQLVKSGKLLLLKPEHGAARPWRPVANPVTCRAVFYRDADVGDLIGYMQGLADFLEERGVLTDDQWIQGWDGSRLALTDGRPRVEVELTPLDHI